VSTNERNKQHTQSRKQGNLQNMGNDDYDDDDDDNNNNNNNNSTNIFVYNH
jgi:hypothetical protein